jgi:hypothetical protein
MSRKRNPGARARPSIQGQDQSPPTKRMGQSVIRQTSCDCGTASRSQAPMWRRAASAVARQGRSLTISSCIMPPATKTNGRLRYNYGGSGAPIHALGCERTSNCIATIACQRTSRVSQKALTAIVSLQSGGGIAAASDGPRPVWQLALTRAWWRVAGSRMQKSPPCNHI